MGLNAVIFGGNWDNGANSGSRCSNWSNSPTNSNNNIGLRCVCYDNQSGTSLWRCHGTPGWPLFMWSAMLSCFGKHLWGFRKTTSSQARACVKVGSGQKARHG